MNPKPKNLLRTGSWQRALLFYGLTLLVATLIAPTVMYLLVTFLTTFDPKQTFQLSVSRIFEFMQHQPEAGPFMLVTYAMATLLYWSVFFNALIRARMLRNRDGRPEVAGNQEYGSSAFADINELAQRYTKTGPITPTLSQVLGQMFQNYVKGKQHNDTQTK